MVVVLGEADDLHSREGGNRQTAYKISYARIYPAFIHYALGHIQYTKKHTISYIMISNKSVTSPCSKLENMAA